MTRRAAIPREAYLAAVRRHDARVAALHGENTPARFPHAVRVRLHAIAREFEVKGIGPEPGPCVLNPVLLEAPDSIARDDMLIALHLADTPGAQPRPKARGRNFYELWASYTQTEAYHVWESFFQREAKVRILRCAAEFGVDVSEQWAGLT